MDFNFGEKMKALRKKRDLTQEQLAERLGVSPQSVSKWETNAAYPDIAMFPVLAYFYGVTTDELLGVDLSKSEEKISGYIDEILELYHQWKHEEMIALCRKACYEFPGSVRLKYQLAFCLSQAGQLGEAATVCQSILDDCPDTMLRLLTLSQLCYCHHWLGDDKTALEYANQLPNLNSTRVFLIGRLGLYKGREKLDYSRMCVGLYLSSLFEVTNQLADARHGDEGNDLPDAERIEILKTLLRLLDAAFGDDLLDKSWDAYALNRDIAILYLRINNKDEAFAHLEKAYAYAVLHGQYSDDACFESPLVKGVKAQGHSHWSQGALDDFRQELHNPKFAAAYEPIKDDPRLAALSEKLQNRAHA